MSQISSMTADMAAAFPADESFARTPPIALAARRSDFAGTASRALKAAAVSWFVVVAMGRLLFVAYVIGFFGRAAARGDFAAWNKALTHGIDPGDTAGNLVVFVHIGFASVITVGGLLQLVPQIRQLAPTFHASMIMWLPKI